MFQIRSTPHRHRPQWQLPPEHSSPITWRTTYTCESTKIQRFVVVSADCLGDESIILQSEPRWPFHFIPQEGTVATHHCSLRHALMVLPLHLIIDDPSIGFVSLPISLFSKGITEHSVQVKEIEKFRAHNRRASQGRHTALQRRSCAGLKEAAPFS